MSVRFQCLPETLSLSNEYQVPYPPQFFKLPTTMAAVGTRGSGKTYALTRLNKYLFDHGYFTRMFVISPTFASNKIMEENCPIRTSDVYEDRNAGWEAIEDIQKKVKADADWYKEVTEQYAPLYRKVCSSGFLSLDKLEKKFVVSFQAKIEQFYESFLQESASILVESPAYTQILDGMLPLPHAKGIFEKLNGTYDEEQIEEKDLQPYLFRPPQLPRPAPLLFIDDMSHTTLYSSSPNNPLVNLTLRHRHLGGQGYGLSLQYAVQTFHSGLTRALRSNTMQFLIFKTNALDVLDQVYEELGAFTTREEFGRLYHRAIRDRHDFLLVDVNATDPDRVFRRGFEEILLQGIEESDLAPLGKEEGVGVEETKSASSKRKRSRGTAKVEM